MPVLEIGMVFTHQGQPAMKTTTCLTLKWRLLARVARPCLSSASHFFGFRISPSWSEIFNRRRISFLNSDVDKFFGRLGKIEGFFIWNPCKRCCLYFKQSWSFLLIVCLEHSPVFIDSIKACTKDAHFKSLSHGPSPLMITLKGIEQATDKALKLSRNWLSQTDEHGSTSICVITYSNDVRDASAKVFAKAGLKTGIPPIQ